jgi:Ni/Fe-hydrogenase subunit HybB-like protein
LLIASEIVTLAFTRSDSALNLVQVMLTSRLFWVEIICGLGSIIILALPSLRKQQAGLLAASALGLIHLAAKRMSFVNMGFAVPNINYPGVNIARSGIYSPNLIEWGLVVGLIGLLVLLLTVGLGILGLGASKEN